MRKIDVFSLPRPERLVEERTFAADGHTITLAFRRPDAADMNMAATTAKRLCEEFITGIDGLPPATFWDEIKVSESLFMLAASAQEMQPPDRRIYSAEEFVVMMDRLPTDGVRIAQFIREMQMDWRAHQGNGSGAPTERPSVPGRR